MDTCLRVASVGMIRLEDFAAFELEKNGLDRPLPRLRVAIGDVGCGGREVKPGEGGGSSCAFDPFLGEEGRSTGAFDPFFRNLKFPIESAVSELKLLNLKKSCVGLSGDVDKDVDVRGLVGE